MSRNMWFVAIRKITVFAAVILVCVATTFIAMFYTNMISFAITFTDHAVSDNKSSPKSTLQSSETNLTNEGDSNISSQFSATVQSTPPLQTISVPAILQKHKPESVSSQNNVTSNLANQSTTRLENLTLANNIVNNIVVEHQSLSAAMTFNSTLEIYCKNSLFVECGAESVKKVTSQKIFKIMFYRRPRYMTEIIFNMSSCQYNACRFEDFKEAKETDVVLVFGVRLKDKSIRPRRWPHQIYVAAMWESPLHTDSDFLRNESSVWNNQMELTMTYRVDSDIFTPYGDLSFVPKPLNERPNYYEIAKRKSRTAVWIVSNCDTPSRRDKYVQKMKKHIDIDTFGKCGRSCPISNITCLDIASTYKFYLSFENSICTDYVTEKFFKLFTPGNHVIPVVRGGADYDKYFPQNTFINAAHFKTAKDLALYLKNLASDLATYSKYLEYKDLYTLSLRRGHIGCEICKYLHTHEVLREKRYSLKAWFGDGYCRPPNDI